MESCGKKEVLHFAVLYLENDGACLTLNLEPLELTGLMIKSHVCMVSGKLFAELKTNMPVTWLLMSGLTWFPASPLFLPTAGSPGILPAAQLVPPHTLIRIPLAADRDCKNSSGLPGNLAPPTLVSKPALLWVWPCHLEPLKVAVHLSDVPECIFVTICPALWTSNRRLFTPTGWYRQWRSCGLWNQPDVGSNFTLDFS